MHIFGATNLNGAISVGVTECDNKHIHRVASQTKTISAFSNTEFAFTVVYSVNGELMPELISCTAVVRNEKHMLIAKRRYVMYCCLFRDTMDCVLYIEIYTTY